MNDSIAALEIVAKGLEDMLLSVLFEASVLFTLAILCANIGLLNHPTSSKFKQNLKNTLLRLANLLLSVYFRKMDRFA